MRIAVRLLVALAVVSLAAPQIASASTGLGLTTPAAAVPCQTTLEPDADADALGDESQDACLGLPGSVAGCPKADLALTQAASHGAESDLVTYTLVARSNGPDGVTDAAISDTLPPGATFVSSSGPPCSASGRSVNCAVGALASGGSGTVTIAARLKAGNGQANTATIASAQLARA